MKLIIEINKKWNKKKKGWREGKGITNNELKRKIFSL